MNLLAEEKQGDGVYLFCLARSALLGEFQGTAGDGQTPIHVQSCREIAAVVRSVSLEEFTGPEAEARLQDLSWIGPRACRHEEIIEQVMNCSPVLPVPFGTIFASPASLQSRLLAHYEAAAGFLDRVSGQEEWAVKGLLDRTKAKEKLRDLALAREAGTLITLSPGARYFKEQRLLAELEKGVGEWLQQVRGKIHGSLEVHASDFCERKLLSRGVTGEDREMVLNWAFLTPPSAVASLRERIDLANAEYDGQGLFFQLSGPWPPYSFCPSFAPEEDR